MGIPHSHPPHLCIALVLSSFAPCFLLFCLVACTRPHVPLCPSVGWLVRRTAFLVLFVPVGSFWVILGRIGSFWVDLGQVGSFWSSGSRTRLIGVFRETPNSH